MLSLNSKDQQASLVSKGEWISLTHSGSALGRSIMKLAQKLITDAHTQHKFTTNAPPILSSQNKWKCGGGGLVGPPQSQTHEMVIDSCGLAVSCWENRPSNNDL